MLKLGIGGCNGRMGKALIQAAVGSQEAMISAALVSPGNKLIDTDVGLIAGVSPINVRPSDNLNKIIDQFDVFIDFTTVYATLSHIAVCQQHHKNMVIGTTGFTEDQKKIIEEAAKTIGIILSPNMSIGMNLCFQLAKQAAKIFGDNADVEILEAHHRHKVDAPSGTSLKMGQEIAKTLNRDFEQVAVFERHGITGPRDSQSIGFSTIRGGDTVGEHTVMFAGEGERVEITHRATSRSTFAVGAIRAAKWLAFKGPGLYTMADVLGFD